MGEKYPWLYNPPEKKRFNKRILTTIVVCVLATTIGVIAVNNYLKTITHGGDIKTEGLGVYWDFACTDPCTHIYWGNLVPGETYNKTTYVRNEGDWIISLNFNHTTLSENVTLTLYYDISTLNPNEIREVIWSLTISENATNEILAWTTMINATKV